MLIGVVFIVIFLVVMAVQLAIKLDGCPPGARHSFYASPFGTRPPIDPALRNAVLERNRVDDMFFCCSYCGEVGTRYVGPDGRHWEVDHCVPFSMDGPTIYENLYLACTSCNQRKGARTWRVSYP